MSSAAQTPVDGVYNGVLFAPVLILTVEHKIPALSRGLAGEWFALCV